MRDAGIQVDVQSVDGIYVAALPSEYELEIRELNRNQVLNRNKIINLVQAQYDLLSREKNTSPTAHALVVDGRGGAGGRGHPGCKRGGRGGGRGHNGNRKVKGPATETTAPRTTISWPNGRCATTAVAEATSPATAP